jgi:hypothetical protein
VDSIHTLKVRRFQGFMADREFIKPRCSETLGRQYGMTYPHQNGARFPTEMYN